MALAMAVSASGASTYPIVVAGVLLTLMRHLLSAFLLIRLWYAVAS
jgi:hypothetical protein